MKKFIQYISAVCTALVLMITPSCDFGDTNIDPTKVTEEQVTLNLSLPSAIEQLGFTEGAEGGRTPGIFMQYFLGTDAQQIALSQYNMQDNVMNNLWRTGMYGGGMKDLKLIIKKTTATEGGEGTAIDAPYYRGIAKVLMAEHLDLLTTFFGDIPYSQAFDGAEGNITPAYDTQEEIYAAIEILINEGIADLTGEAGDIVPANDDLIYGGDAAAWAKAAYGLKARYMMQQGKYEEASQALPNALASNADNALFPFEESLTGGNPYKLFENQRPSTLAMHPHYIEVLAGDPRYPLLIGPSNGFSDEFWTSLGSSLKMITYSEVAFMRAEIAARGGDAAAAEAAMKDGVRAEMALLGVDAGEAELYILGLSGGDLTTVMNEKYKSMYPLTHVAWADQRRTGLPALVPNKTIKTTTTTIPQRFPYPSSEDQFNKASKDAALARLGITTEDGKIFKTLPVFE